MGVWYLERERIRQSFVVYIQSLRGVKTPNKKTCVCCLTIFFCKTYSVKIIGHNWSLRGGFQRGNTIEKCSPLVPFYAPFWALQKGATNVNESIMRKKVIYVDKAEKKNLRNRKKFLKKSKNSV